MAYLIRKADSGDVPQLERLLAAYVRETYQGAWGGSAERLASDILDRTFEMLIAETGEQAIIGFIGWTNAYDLHWCLKGGEIIDLYVAPEHRGRAAALFLATELAAEIERRGGAFLHGGAAENAAARKLYRRFTMMQPNGECYVSGRAFRHFAALAGADARTIVTNLPEAAWNYEP